MPAITSKLAKFRARTRSEQRLLLAALLLLPLFRAGLCVLGFSRVQRWLHRHPAKRRPPLVFEEACVIGTLINSAAYHALGPGNCLPRSLYLQWLLRRRGVDSELRIGVRLEPGALAAHAWVEVGGRAVNDAPDVAKRFAAFDRPLSVGLFSGP